MNPMSTTERDYYELLGVSRDADEGAIKKAFRVLARKLHPDVSEEPDAEVRFREVSEAYEVLSNTETRQLYDRYGHAGLKSGGYQPRNFDMADLSDIFSAFFGGDVFDGRRGGGATRGADIGAEVVIELADAAAGAEVTVPLEVAIGCDTCSGSGVEPGSPVSSCGRCAGSGRLQQVSNSVFGDFVRTASCPQCGGTGRLVEKHCADCGGQGRTVTRRDVTVDIPAGIHDGQRIRLSGEGHAGTAGGPTGDLYVSVRVREHELFTRDGNDIFSKVDLTIVQAALGAKVSVETLDGIVEVEFSGGTQPGDTKVLRGKGMPVLQGFGKGDHRLFVNVLVPRHLTDEQRELLGEFEKTSDEHTYKPDEGLFNKLKSAFR